MPTTLQNAARKAVQAKPCPKSPQACNGCRDNFYLPELHHPDALHVLDVFDGPAVRGQIDRRRACMACPDAAKPCLQAQPADAAPAAPAPAPAPTVAALVLQAQDDTESVRSALHSIAAVADMLQHEPAAWLEDDLQALLHVLNDTLRARLQELDKQVASVRARLPQRPIPRDCFSSAVAAGKHKHLAFEAADLVENLRRDATAFTALRDLAQHARSATLAYLATTLRLIVNYQAAQLHQLDEKLDELHAALIADLEAAPRLEAELAAAAQLADDDRQKRQQAEAARFAAEALQRHQQREKECAA